jgi:hypothetical protein
MAKTAIKTTKKVSKVSTAKGKGKTPKAKVIKKTAKPVTKKAVAKKPAVKKVKAPKIVDPNKYGKFIILDTPTDKYPDMVTITVAPKMYDDFIGRKYVSRDRCITTIESVRIGDSIDKGAKSVIKELDSIGLVPMEAGDTDEEK